MKLIDTKNKNEIYINDNFVLRCDDFLSIEIDNFDWLRHTNKCETCKKLLESFETRSLDNWIAEFNGECFILLNQDLGTGETSATKRGICEYKNYLGYTCSSEFDGTKFKLKVKKIDTSQIEIYAKLEKYEICNFLLKIKKNE